MALAPPHRNGTALTVTLCVKSYQSICNGRKQYCKGKSWDWAVVSGLLSLRTLEVEVKQHFSWGPNQSLAFLGRIDGQKVRICNEVQLAQMKWTSRELTILVNVVSNSSPTEYAHNSPNVPTSELALVVLPSEMDVNKYGMVGEPFTDANEVIIPSGTATNDKEKGGPSGTPTTNIEVSCPRSYPEGPPPSEDGYPDVQPGQFAEEDDEPIGINMEGQYNHIFLMELEPVPNGPTPQTDEEDRVGPGDTINEADEQGDVGIPDIPYFCHDKENPTIQKKSTFSDKVTFVLALRQNAIKEEYDFHIEHSDGDRFRARCTNIECKWRIHASRLKPEKTFMVKKLPEMHTCGSANKKTGGKMATKAWVAERSLDILRKEPTMGAKILYDKLEEKYNIKLDYHMVWKGRCVALAELQGTYEQSFQALWNFKAEIESKCPGSVVEIDVEHDDADEDAAASAEHSMFFKRLFVAFKPCIDGFLTGCRPYLSADSTHLTGRYTGQLASANAVDGHTWMFPVAFGIFDKETEDNWDWFLRQLQNCIGNPPRLVIHSDANKGLEKAIPKVFNVGVEHRECFRHLLSNFKKKFRGTILCHMWPAAWAYRTDKFQQYMEKVATERSDAIQYLEENHKHLWSRCMFSTMSKVEYVNNNLAECFNSWIRHIKEYPLVELVDTLRQMIMVKLFERRKIADKLIGVILPQVIKELNKKSKGLRYTLYCGSLTAAEVTGMSKDNKPWRFVVDLMGGSCTCGQWQLTGKPCTHALALIFSNPELRLENMVDGYYSIESFKAAYSGVLTPIGDKCDWLQVDPGFVMLPPLLGRSASRPRKKRIKKHDEAEVRQRVCNRCKEYGHIARTCKNKMAEPGTMPHQPPENYKRKISSKGNKNKKAKSGPSTPSDKANKRAQTTPSTPSKRARIAAAASSSPGPVTRSQTGSSTLKKA